MPPALNDARSTRWWVSDSEGRLALAQWPNPALAVWLAAFVLGRIGMFDEDRAETIRAVGDGALIVWALDELVRGASPIRRLLGAVVLAIQLAGLFG